MTAVFGITGWKNSGKTTMVASLVSEFVSRGFRVSTIKNAHDAFDVDQEGTDSHTHRQAGASEVAIVSSKRWALMHEVQTAGAIPSLETMIDKLAPCDIILVEGFKDSDIAKLECIRGKQAEAPVYTSRNRVIAVATDEQNSDHDLPRFNIDDITAIADFIAQHEGLGL